MCNYSNKETKRQEGRRRGGEKRLIGYDHPRYGIEKNPLLGPTVRSSHGTLTLVTLVAFILKLVTRPATSSPTLPSKK
jgi:hypothetical protein